MSRQIRSPKACTSKSGVEFILSKLTLSLTPPINLCDSKCKFFRSEGGVSTLLLQSVESCSWLIKAIVGILLIVVTLIVVTINRGMSDLRLWCNHWHTVVHKKITYIKKVVILARHNYTNTFLREYIFACASVSHGTKASITS